MFELAQTAWPRFGGDQANRSLLRIRGPHSIPTWHILSLPTSHSVHDLDYAPSGVIVMSDEALHVLHAGVLSAIKLDGTILWQLDLGSLSPGKMNRLVCSLPTALQNGETLLYFPGMLVIVDGTGNMRKQKYKIKVICDGNKAFFERPFLTDPATSPNLTYNNIALLPTIPGEVYLFREGHLQKLGHYGYDIPMPAVYPDNSLAIAGYYGTGFCRVNLDGTIQWRTHLSEADLLPTLNYEYVAAVGSLNNGCSAFFNSSGEQIGEYQHAAKFAVYPDGGWIALSKQRLARLTLEGKEVWACEIAQEKGYSSFVEQPLVDSEGFTFIRQNESILCFDPKGRTAFEATLPAPELLSIVATGTIACVVGNELFIGYS